MIQTVSNKSNISMIISTPLLNQTALYIYRDDVSACALLGDVHPIDAVVVKLRRGGGGVNHSDVDGGGG